MDTKIHTPAAAVLLAVVLAACGSATAMSTASGPDTISADSAATLEAIYLARQDSAQMRFTEADVQFMTRMIHHHGQALEMARLADGRTSNNQILTLAARIINAQNDEIATMQRWLADRDQPVPEPGGHMHHGGMTMPGMATPEQLQRLEEARGNDFDRLFLSLMIPHHEGAVTMVHELFATDGAGQDEEAFKIASDAQVDQATEVDRMELMLSELPR